MSEKLVASPGEAAALDLERRRIALKIAAEWHDPRDLSAMIATASNLYGWLRLSPRTLMRQADPAAGRRAEQSAETSPGGFASADRRRGRPAGISAAAAPGPRGARI